MHEVVVAILTHKGKDFVGFTGSFINALQLRSSLTLFDVVSPNDIFRDVLDALFESKGDRRSLDAIRKMER